MSRPSVYFKIKQIIKTRCYDSSRWLFQISYHLNDACQTKAGVVDGIFQQQQRVVAKVEELPWIQEDTSPVNQTLHGTDAHIPDDDQSLASTFNVSRSNQSAGSNHHLILRLEQCFLPIQVPQRIDPGGNQGSYPGQLVHQSATRRCQLFRFHARLRWERVPTGRRILLVHVSVNTRKRLGRRDDKQLLRNEWAIGFTDTYAIFGRWELDRGQIAVISKRPLGPQLERYEAQGTQSAGAAAASGGGAVGQKVVVVDEHQRFMCPRKHGGDFQRAWSVKGKLVFFWYTGEFFLGLWSTTMIFFSRLWQLNTERRCSWFSHGMLGVDRRPTAVIGKTVPWYYVLFIVLFIQFLWTVEQ